jgi:hypothetical protein
MITPFAPVKSTPTVSRTAAHGPFSEAAYDYHTLADLFSTKPSFSVYVTTNPISDCPLARVISVVVGYDHNTESIYEVFFDPFKMPSASLNEPLQEYYHDIISLVHGPVVSAKETKPQQLSHSQRKLSLLNAIIPKSIVPENEQRDMIEKARRMAVVVTI